MRSIKAKLLLWVLAIIILSTTSIAVISMYTARKNLKDQVNEGISTLVADDAKLLESRIQNEKLIVENIASQSEIEGMMYIIQAPVLKAYLGSTDFLELGIVDTEGKVKYTDGTEADLSDRDYIKEALTGKTVVSDVIISKVTNEPVMMIAAPIYKNSTLAGLVLARSDANKMSTVISDMGYGDNGYGYIINDEGTVMAHPDKSLVTEMFNPIKEVGEDKSLTSVAALFTKILKEKQGVYEYTYDGKDIYSGYAAIPDTTWYYVVTADKKEVMSRLTDLTGIIIASFVISLVISTIITLILGNSIVNPIARTVKHAGKIANLDISSDMEEKYLKKKDEIGMLAGALQNIMQSFRGIIMELKSASAELTDTAGKMTEMSEESAASSQEISTTISELARAATNHAEHTQEGSLRAQDLGGAIEKNQKSFMSLNKATKKMVIMLEEGTGAMDTLRIRTEENNSAADEIREVITRTNESAQRIGQASEMISQIAEQTNLLALNAAIEAARAGEAGKGFAVVADEIRKLAEQSTSSTSEIDKIVEELQKNTNGAVRTIEKMTLAIGEQAQSVDNSQRSFEGISGAIHRANDAVDGLSKSGDEMEQVKMGIIETMESLSAIAEEDSASTEELSASLEEQTASLEEMATSSKTMDELATKLETIIRKFQV